MIRYVVVVKPPDDHPGEVRVFGPWRDHAAALAFRDKVRSKVDSMTDPSEAGYAYIKHLEVPRLLDAKNWATLGVERLP